VVRQVVIATLLVAGVAGVALAHAALRRADPPAGGRVSQPPRELRLEFSEAVAARTSRIELIAPDSQRFGLPVRADSALANVLLAEVPPLTVAGPYRVEWRLVGPDGHAVTGTYGFVIDSILSVQVDTVVPMTAEQYEAEEPPSDMLSQQIVRFASSLALVVAIGTIAFALFVLPSVALDGDGVPLSYQDTVDGRLRSLGTLAGWSLLFLAVVRLVSQAAVLSGSMQSLRLGDLGDLITSSTFGRGWLLQVLASIFLVVALRARPSVRWRLALAAAVAMAVSAAMLGHAAAVTDVQALAIGVDAAHALAAGGWAGGILVLTVSALPEMARVPGERRLILARNLLRAFSPLALVCAAILVVTGATSAWLQLRDIGLVLNSPYGLALIRKVVIVLMIAALGAWHWRVVQPSLGTERSMARLRLSVAIDAALVVLVLVLTTMLTGTAPPIR
jgi:putative copper export protein/methionine-rich copper-binding protein CopC